MRRLIVSSFVSTVALALGAQAYASEDGDPADSTPRPPAASSLAKAMPARNSAVAVWAAFDSALGDFRSGPEIVETRDRWARDIFVGVHASRHGSLDLLLTIPRQQTVDVHLPGGASLRMGTFRRLPPTVFARWRFNPAGRIRPYLGAGVNLSGVMDHRLTIDDGAGGALPLRLESALVGPALQAGAEAVVAGHWSVSVDVHKAWIDSSVTAEGIGQVGAVESDPVNYTLRLGYRFR